MSAGAIVIVGAGQAGGWAAATLRGRGYRGRIVLLGDEPHAPYERPPLSKAVLGGQAAPDSTELFSRERLAELDITFRPGVAATRLWPERHQVETSEGAVLDYDKLILCTGGRPIVPALPGVDGPAVHVLRTRDDALRLRTRLGPGRRVVIAGGGWIGLEVAATARQAGCATTVLEQAPRLCARSVPPGVSAHLAALHSAQGVTLRFDTGLRAVQARPDGSCVAELADGGHLEADAVVLGVGMQANDTLARAAGIACDRGVLVDEYCRTSAPDVLAAGDVAVAASAAGPLRLESWQNAQDQGAAAACAALDAGQPYVPSGAVWSEQYDAMVQIAGFPARARREVLRPQADARALLSVALDEGDRVVGAVAVNAARELRPLRQWIAQGARVDPGRLARADAPLSSARIG
ncbi:MAG: NAD(P)/FAD-dependent oxidoreductase [Achromobacter sp.]|uniref:NAD(P)/FAD-dependent oxidoreductase n=1 Tax=Achromobacter sp. TaxID=134375 RepID=UPI003CFCB9C3